MTDNKPGFRPDQKVTSAAIREALISENHAGGTIHTEVSDGFGVDELEVVIAEFESVGVRCEMWLYARFDTRIRIRIRERWITGVDDEFNSERKISNLCRIIRSVCVGSASSVDQLLSILSSITKSEWWVEEDSCEADLSCKAVVHRAIDLAGWPARQKLDFSHGHAPFYGITRREFARIACREHLWAVSLWGVHGSQRTVVIELPTGEYALQLQSCDSRTVEHCLAAIITAGRQLPLECVHHKFLWRSSDFIAGFRLKKLPVGFSLPPLGISD